MAQAVWNGFLRVSLVSCPVYLVPATSSEKRIQLDPLNARTGNPVARQFVDSKTGDVVSDDAVVTGCKVDDARYVTLSAEDLKGLASGPPNVIDIEQFVPRDQVGRLYLDAACYIQPEGPLAADTVQALRLALDHSGRIGIGRVVIGERERVVLIEAYGAALMLSPLQPLQPVEPPQPADTAASGVSAELVEIAEAIIGRRSANFEPTMLRDRSEAALQTLIEAKRGGSAPPPPPPAAPAAPAAPPQPAAPPAVAAPPPAAAEPAPPPAAAEPTPPPAAAEPAPVPPAAAAAASPASPPPPPPPPPPPSPPATEAAAPPPEPPAPPLPSESPSPPSPSAAAPPPPEEPPLPEPAPLPLPRVEMELPLTPPPPTEGTLPPHRLTATPVGHHLTQAPSPQAPPEADPPPAEAITPPSARGAINGSTPVLASLSAGPRELGTEVLLHIMGLGDRRYIETGWAGHPGSHRQIEALSIRPREELPPSAVEFRVFAQEGRATAWVSNGNYAGTRGRGLPLTGFAVRPAADLRDRLEIVYEGSFFEGGVVGPKRDGELCVSPVADDPLEAIRVSIVERIEG